MAIPRVGRNLARTLARLDELAEGAEFLLGHNLIDFDLPHLRAADPGLLLLDLPVVDTFRLNPLAFPPRPLPPLGQALPGRLVRRLRDRPCGDSRCHWCRERHGACSELSRWFGFDAFRAEPAGDDGRPLQKAIVKAAMAASHVLRILPTGTGKSLCYQLPALSCYDKTGALTVVISPGDISPGGPHVRPGCGMNTRGIGSCVTVNGMLSMPERADALERIRWAMPES